MGGRLAVSAAIGDAARGMSEIAERAGLSRESFYRSLSGDGNPSLATVLKVLKALDVKLEAHPA